MVESQIHLIRHGSIDNPKDICYGRLPLPLSEKGAGEVLELCNVLRGRNIHFDALYTSPVLRAQQTAEILEMAGLGEIIEEREELTDVGIGELEGKPMQIIRDAQYSGARLRELGYEIETNEEIMERTREFVRHMKEKHAGETIAFVSHGDVTRLILLCFQGFSAESLNDLDLRDGDYLAPAEVIALQFNSEGEFLGYRHIRKTDNTNSSHENLKRTASS